MRVRGGDEVLGFGSGGGYESVEPLTLPSCQWDRAVVEGI